ILAVVTRRTERHQQATQRRCLGILDEAARLVRQWEAEEAHTPQLLRRLTHLQECLEDWAGAASTVRELLALRDDRGNDAHRRALAMIRRAEYERRAGRPAVSWVTLHDAMAAYPRGHTPSGSSCAISGGNG